MTGKEIWEEIKKVLESNENESKTYYKIWGTAKAVLREKFTIMSAYIKKKKSTRHGCIRYLLPALGSESRQVSMSSRPT